MDRDEFSNNRRTRHFERSKQSDLHNYRDNRRTLRDSYHDENHNEFPEFHGFRPRAQLFVPVPFGIHQNRYPHTITPPLSERDFLFSDRSSDLSMQMSAFHLEDVENRRGVSPKYHHHHYHHHPVSSRSPPHFSGNRFSLLPNEALDVNGDIRSDWTVQTVVDKGFLMAFAMDKGGCHFLQNHFYGPSPPQIDDYLRARIFDTILASPLNFHAIATNIFGNFFLQRIIEQSRPAEQETIRKYLVADITEYCLDKSACRVVQTALEKLRPRHVDAIVDALPRDDQLMAICTDQNANHVIQKIVKKMPLEKWEFVVDFLCQTVRGPDNLLEICQDKYGCRVVQTIIETITSAEPSDEEKLRVLRRLMARIIAKCKRLTSNEFANYVVQHILETPGVLSEYRNAIIEKCLLRNLLSMSQEKYASHVVERAFTFAPLPYLAEMMEEIFDGYLPHPETGKDALDILMFHQFGNYVIQRMLQICCASVLGQRSTIMNGTDCRYKFEAWLRKLSVRARKEKGRLSRFSSGKKMLEILETMNTPYDLDRRPSTMPRGHTYASSSSSSAIDGFCPHSTTSSSSAALFSPPNTSSVTSEVPTHHEFDCFSKF